MARFWILGLIVLSGCARLGAHRPEGRGIVGVFSSYQKGTLTIDVKEHDSSVLDAKNFRIDDDTGVTIFHGDAETHLPAKDAFGDVRAGTPAIVRLDDADRVIAVQLGVRERKRDK